MILSIVVFAAGLALLVAGAETLVRGASRLAAAAGVSPLVIGLTVVAFGTSAPELAVSVKAALDGQSGLVLGNVVGSNIFNVLFILGLSALIAPLAVSVQLIRLDVPLVIALSGVVLLLAADGALGRIDGLLLACGLAAYVVFSVRLGRREAAALGDGDADAAATAGRSLRVDLGLVAVGLVLLVAGSRLLVGAAVDMARALGVSDLIVGLTIVAAGTSMPEVVTSAVATVRRQVDIAVGNVVGSNLFNLMGVLGVSCLLAPDGVQVAPGVLAFDLPVMLAVAFACLPVFFTGGMVSRWEGALFLGYYVAYTVYLVLDATAHPSEAAFSAAMIGFVIPLTGVTLAVVAARELGRRRR